MYRSVSPIPRAQEIDLVILRESTEGLFYSAAVHGRSEVVNNDEVRDVLRITRNHYRKVTPLRLRAGAQAQVTW